MTAEAPAGPTAEPAGLPGWTLDEAQLGDLELMMSGAFAPLPGFLGAADVASVRERSTLADGTPWPLPVTLTVPASAVPGDAEHLVLQDAEGSPLAVLDITERTPGGDGSVEQRWEKSGDGGKTWETVFLGTYRKADPEP